MRGKVRAASRTVGPPHVKAKACNRHTQASYLASGGRTKGGVGSGVYTRSGGGEHWTMFIVAALPLHLKQQGSAILIVESEVLLEASLGRRMRK